MDGDTFSHQICCRFLITANSVVSRPSPGVLSKINNLSACSNFIFMALLILTLGKCTRQLLAEVVRRCEGGLGWGVTVDVFLYLLQLLRVEKHLKFSA